MNTKSNDAIPLTVSQLSGRLPGGFTLGPLSFELKAGRHLGVIGLSGSGKSTLLRMITLFVAATDGTVRTPVSSISFGDGQGQKDPKLIRRHRQYLAYVSQANSLWPHLTVQENVELGLRHVLCLESGDRCARARHVLEQLDLLHLAGRRSWEISGGEARRTAVARAVALQPPVILLDEPDSGLDPIRSQQQMKLILSICEEQGATAVIVSHNPAIIEQCTDVVIVLHDGHAVESGATHVVLEEPKAEITQRIVQSAGWSRRAVGETGPEKIQ